MSTTSATNETLQQHNSTVTAGSGRLFTRGTRLSGSSGKIYQIERLLQERTGPVPYHVYLASNGQNKYVLKTIDDTEFEYQLAMQRPLAGCPNLRVVIDTVREHLLFVFEFLTEDLLQLAQRDNLLDATRRQILRGALTGLADLHKHGIFHTDVKPNNIFVDYDEKSDGTIELKRVQLGDLEMGSVVPEGLNIRGARLGNPMWRSPESHAAARQNLPSDVFSFGLVCIYTVLRIIVLRIHNKEASDAEQERTIVRRLLSHFGDGPGLVGFVEAYLPEDSARFRELVLDIVQEFTPENPRRPFSQWDAVDEEFRDVVTRMTSLDPAQRITAREALEHHCFKHE